MLQINIDRMRGERLKLTPRAATNDHLNGGFDTNHQCA